MSNIKRIQEQIEAAKQKEAKLKARLREEQRKERRHMVELAGNAVVHELETSPENELSKLVLAVLGQTLKSDSDRALFGLPLLSETASDELKSVLAEIDDDGREEGAENGQGL